MNTKYRPSHADATYDAKYGVRAVAGGGRSSARETIARVAAGAIAKKILKLYSNIEIVGYVQRVQVNNYFITFPIIYRIQALFWSCVRIFALNL